MKHFVASSTIGILLSASALYVAGEDAPLHNLRKEQKTVWLSLSLRVFLRNPFGFLFR